MKRANLCHITFTGIDARTDVRALHEIQREFPIAEFGVLVSKNWKENGNRFLDPGLIGCLRKRQNEKRLNLALHICGSAAHDAANGHWDKVDEQLTLFRLGLFQRIQLNIAGRKDNPVTVCPPCYPNQEVIIQQKSIDDMHVYLDSKRIHPTLFSVLLDASGGRGIDTPIRVLDHPGHKVGYAGGFTPDNAGDKLSYLLEQDKNDFWIDMETGVRTDGWFDLNKVVKVLQICKLVLDDHRKGGEK